MAEIPQHDTSPRNPGLGSRSLNTRTHVLLTPFLPPQFGRYAPPRRAPWPSTAPTVAAASQVLPEPGLTPQWVTHAALVPLHQTAAQNEPGNARSAYSGEAPPRELLLRRAAPPPLASL